MKSFTWILAGFVCFSLATAHAQFGGPGGGMGMAQGPRLDAKMAKLFGENSAFSATMQMQSQGGATGDAVTIPGKLSYDNGKSRFEMDLSAMKTARLSAEQAEQMKAMGMDKMVVISRPDKKLNYMIYPGMQSYVEMPLQDASASAADAKSDDFKMESTELGKETVDGHACVKNKVVVTDKEGKKLESTVWNATDLKKFPVKIEHVDAQSGTVTLTYKDIRLDKPEASLFEPPAAFTKAANMMEMMMKAMGGGGAGARPSR